MVQIGKFLCLSDREFPEFFKTHPTFIFRSNLSASKNKKTKPANLFFRPCTIAPNTATTAPTSASPNPGGPAETRTLSITYTWAQAPRSQVVWPGPRLCPSLPPQLDRKCPLYFIFTVKYRENFLVNKEVSRKRRPGEHPAFCCLPW